MKKENIKLIALTWSIVFAFCGYVVIMLVWWILNEREIKRGALEYPWILVVAESIHPEESLCDLGSERAMQKVETLWVSFQIQRGNQVGEREPSVIAEFINLSGFRFSFSEPTIDFAGRARSVDQYKERFETMLGAARAEHPGFISVLRMGPFRYFDVLSLVGSKSNYFVGSEKMRIFKIDNRIALIDFLHNGLISVSLMFDVEGVSIFQDFTISANGSAIENKNFVECLLLDIISTIKIRNVENIRSSWDVMTNPLPGVREK